MCKHPTEALMGTADGIICRKCGKVFPSFATLHADPEADRASQAAPKAPAAQEKPENAPVEAAEAPKKGRKKKANA